MLHTPSPVIHCRAILAAIIILRVLCTPANASELQEAMRKGDSKAFSSLLARGLDPNMRDEAGQPLIVVAAGREEVEIVKLLLDKGANPDATDRAGWTAMHMASAAIRDWKNSEEKRIAIVRALLAAGGDVNAKEHSHATPFDAAEQSGFAELQRVLIDGGAQVSNDRQLNVAVRLGDIARAEALLKKGASAKGKEGRNEPLFYAAQRGQEKMVELLIDRGAQVDAAMEGTGLTPLMAAAIRGHVPVLRSLLDRGAVVNARADMGFTALMGAALEGRKEAVAFLLEKGADPSLATTAGDTALSLARQKGRTEVVELLGQSSDKNGHTTK